MLKKPVKAVALLGLASAALYVAISFSLVLVPQLIGIMDSQPVKNRDSVGELTFYTENRYADYEIGAGTVIVHKPGQPGYPMEGGDKLIMGDETLFVLEVTDNQIATVALLPNWQADGLLVVTTSIVFALICAFVYKLWLGVGLNLYYFLRKFGEDEFIRRCVVIEQ